MKKQDHAKKILTTTFIVLIVTAAVTAAAGKNIFTDMYSAFMKPFQQTAAAVMEDRYMGRSKEELESENAELHAEVDELLKRVIDYDDIKKENELLRKYYGIKDDHPDYKVAVADIIRRDPNDDFYGFTIDKGSRDDIRKNDPVIINSGLVGWVSEVSVTTAKVTTLLSPEAKVGAMDMKTHDSGIATGSANYCSDGQFILSVISADNKIKEGDIVVTTGVGGVYPPGLVVGKVTKLDYNVFDTTPYAVIKPYDDLRSISDVVVITDFEGQGVIEEAPDTDVNSDSDKKNNTDKDTEGSDK